jgi:SAM-dependent methyltransferase
MSPTDHGDGDHTATSPGRPGGGHDAGHWDRRYARIDRLWSTEPNTTVAQVLSSLPPGRALDLGAGEGRHAVWLSRRGWQVTAVDFSRVGIDRGRAVDPHVDWVVADVLTWSPPDIAEHDLVLVSYLHLPTDVFARARGWLAPGGRLVVIGHALRNLTDGVGGPSDPRLLHTPEQLAAAADAMEVERLGEVLRHTPDGIAIDLCLVALNRCDR